jgi:hypothetical protein
VPAAGTSSAWPGSWLRGQQRQPVSAARRGSCVVCSGARGCGALLLLCGIGPAIATSLPCSSTCSSLPSGRARFFSALCFPQTHTTPGTPKMIGTYASCLRPHPISWTTRRGIPAKHPPNAHRPMVPQCRLPSCPAPHVCHRSCKFCITRKQRADAVFTHPSLTREVRSSRHRSPTSGGSPLLTNPRAPIRSAGPRNLL